MIEPAAKVQLALYDAPPDAANEYFFELASDDLMLPANLGFPLGLLFQLSNPSQGF